VSGARDGASIDNGDTVAAPKVLESRTGVGLADQGLMDLLQSFQRQVASGLAVGAVFIGRGGPGAGATEGLSLADGLATRGSGLGHLPQKRPEGQTEGPGSLSRMRALVLLGQAPGRHPGLKAQLELVEGWAQGGAQAANLVAEAAKPSWKEGGCHRTVYILSY